MKNRPRSLSAAIATQPEAFDLDELVVAVARLVRGDTTRERAAPQQIDLYVQQGLVDAPGPGGKPYHRRHLLQVLAIQSLRGLDLGMERIRELVQGVDDTYLRMLCDEPAEAEKKAAVMTNWLNMLSSGRVGRDDRGETHLLNGPSAPAEPRPVMHVAPVRNNRGVAPALDLRGADLSGAGGFAGFGAPSATAPPEDLPDAHPHADLPDGPLAEEPVPPPRPDTREIRPERATFAASASLSAALRRQMAHPEMSATPQVPVRVQRVASPTAGAAVTRAAGAPFAGRDHAQAYEASGEDGDEDGDEAATAAALPVPQAWIRLRVAEGVELHVQTGHTPLRGATLAEVMAQIRGLIGE